VAVIDLHAHGLAIRHLGQTALLYVQGLEKVAAVPALGQFKKLQKPTEMYRIPSGIAMYKGMQEQPSAPELPAVIAEVSASRSWFSMSSPVQTAHGSTACIS